MNTACSIVYFLVVIVLSFVTGLIIWKTVTCNKKPTVETMENIKSAESEKPDEPEEPEEPEEEFDELNQRILKNYELVKLGGGRLVHRTPCSWNQLLPPVNCPLQC
jgi:hypothetical protein